MVSHVQVCARLCSDVAQDWCEAKGWVREDTPLTPAEAGNIVCTIDGRGYGSDCDMCGTYNIVTWRTGSVIQGCNDVSAIMQPGKFYSAHTPCQCGDNVDLCGSWNMQGCLPDGVAICGPNGEPCDQLPWVYIDAANGRAWAWASPCSGGCSMPDPAGVDGYVMPGWRFPTDQDWAVRPAPTVWGDGAVIECASEYFDPTYDHCDWGDVAVQSLDAGTSETWFVHDL